MCILKSFGGIEKTKVIPLSNEIRHCASSYQHFFLCFSLLLFQDENCSYYRIVKGKLDHAENNPTVRF